MVATLQYLLLSGISPEKLTVITFYEGQRKLLLDVLKYRCAEEDDSNAKVFSGKWEKIKVLTVEQAYPSKNEGKLY